MRCDFERMRQLSARQNTWGMMLPRKASERASKSPPRGYSHMTSDFRPPVTLMIRQPISAIIFSLGWLPLPPQCGRHVWLSPCGCYSCSPLLLLLFLPSLRILILSAMRTGTTKCHWIAQSKFKFQFFPGNECGFGNTIYLVAVLEAPSLWPCLFVLVPPQEGH